MDKLMSGEDKLCMWLSSDPDYILDKCGDILSMNEFREAQKQSSAVDKMRVLLKIITQKGKDTAQRFCEIVMKHQAHYPQLQQVLNPSAEGSATPKVITDGVSVATTREITNMKGKNLNMKIDSVSHPGSGASGKDAGQALGADLTAVGSSLICADKISNVTMDGDIDLSVSLKPTNACAGTEDKTLPSSQGPSAKTITKHKTKIIDCLKSDHSYILQLVHEKEIVTQRYYDTIKNILQPEDKMIALIDHVIDNGEETCSKFLEALKEPDVFSTFPRLKEMTKNW